MIKFEFGKSLARKLKDRVEGFEFEVGILDDGPHRDPVDTPLFGKPQTTSYAGGPVRKATREIGPLSIADILQANSERLNIDLLRAPFQDEANENIVRFMQAYLKGVLNEKVNMKRVENLLQAVVRNPILRGDYGGNSAWTADNKGFDRHLFDTGQTFKAIRARANRV